MRRLLGFAVLSLSLLPVGSALASIEITSCGQVVPDGKLAHLLVDLDCASGIGVTLGNNAKIKLHGHVLSGSADSANVSCTGARCKISGPGEIVGGYFAVIGDAVLKITDLTVRDQVGGGLDGIPKVVARRVVMSGIGFGYDPPNASDIIRGGTLDASNVWIHDNAGSVVVVDYVVRRSTIEDNGGIGIGGPGEGRLITSIVTGNLGGPLGEPIDVFGVTAPRMKSSVCGHSYDANTAMPFGICLGD